MNDLIDRQAAIDALRVAYWDGNIQSAKDDPCIVDAMTDWAIRQVKALPSAQPEPPRAYWIRGKYSWDDYHYNDTSYKCSRCGKVDANIPRYCPGCGAKMEEEIR